MMLLLLLRCICYKFVVDSGKNPDYFEFEKNRTRQNSSQTKIQVPNFDLNREEIAAHSRGCVSVRTCTKITNSIVEVSH